MKRKLANYIIINIKDLTKVLGIQGLNLLVATGLPRKQNWGFVTENKKIGEYVKKILCNSICSGGK